MIVEDPTAPVIPKTVPKFFAVIATTVSTEIISRVVTATIQYLGEEIPIKSRIIWRSGWEKSGMLKHIVTTIATRQIRTRTSLIGNESRTLFVT